MDHTEIQVVYHFLGKTGWSTVVEIGMHQIPNGNFHEDGLVPLIFTTFSQKIRNYRVNLEDGVVDIMSD